MTTVLYPGSFDPIHNGHLEIIEVASGLFDEVVVAAMRNPQKGEPRFGLEARTEMLNKFNIDRDELQLVLRNSRRDSGIFAPARAFDGG